MSEALQSPPENVLPGMHFVPVGIGAIVLGVALLLAGRHLFWLFVGAVGFVVALDLASPYLGRENEGMALAFGLVVGIAGALLAIFVQKLAIGLAGAIAGGYYLHFLLDATALHDPRYGWVTAVVGAVIGALLFSFLFKWALIVLSSVVGAHLLVQWLVWKIHMQPGAAGALFLALCVVGVLVQSRQGPRAE